MRNFIYAGGLYFPDCGWHCTHLNFEILSGNTNRILEHKRRIPKIKQASESETMETPCRWAAALRHPKRLWTGNFRFHKPSAIVTANRKIRKTKRHSKMKAHFSETKPHSKSQNCQMTFGHKILGRLSGTNEASKVVHNPNGTSVGSAVFGRPFVKRFALCYRSVVCLPCLSVCNAGALWPNGWTDPDETWHAGRPRPWPHSVRWGPSSPSPEGPLPPIFGP